MKVDESSFQPSPVPSIGVHAGELEELTRHLESRLASIDSKLDRLLQDAVETKSASAIGSGSPGSNAIGSTADLLSGKGWLAVTASGGCSPRWSEGADIANQKLRDPVEGEQSITTRGVFESERNTTGHISERFVVVPEETEVEEGEISHTFPEVKPGGQTSQQSRTLSKLSQGRMSMISKKSFMLDAVAQKSERVMQFIGSRGRPRWKDKMWIFFQDPDTSTYGYIYERLMRLVIVASVISTLLQTLPKPPMDQRVSSIVESAFEVYFLLELFVRFIAFPNYKSFWLNSYNWIDLVSGAFLILRASLGFVIPIPKDCHLRCSLLVGFCPVVRSLKMLRRMRQFHLLYKAFITSYQSLQPLLSIYCFLLLVFTGVVWVVEPRSNLANFPTAAWMVFISMTTVGYGDFTPDTPGGAVIVCIAVMMGMLYMAIPVGIIGNAFNDVWKDRDRLLVLERTRERLTGAGFKPSDLPEILQIFDNDDNGQLDSAEFCWMLQGLRLGLTQDRRKELFKAFAENSNGGVTHKEFVRALFPESVDQIYGKEDSRPDSISQMESIRSSALNNSIPAFVSKLTTVKSQNWRERQSSCQSANTSCTSASLGEYSNQRITEEGADQRAS